jgi:hypothetical protein
MFARIRTAVTSAFATLLTLARTGIAYTADTIADMSPVCIDRTVASLDKVVVKLERAEAQQRAIADFEVRVQNASYDREDAAIDAADRAARVRKRVQALLA